MFATFSGADMSVATSGRGRTRAFLAVLVASAALGVGACGSDDTKPAPRPSTPAASIATTPAQVAQTPRGSVGYRSVGSGAPLVLIMGFGSSMEDWEPGFVDALARTHRVVIFDNAGIGKSKALASKLTISGMADQTSALIKALSLGKADVLGWSMGGMIAQALTVRHPGDVGHLVLSATQPGTGKAHEIPKAAAKALASASPDEFLAALYPDNQKAALKLYTDGIARYKDRSTVPDTLYGLQRAAINGWLAGSEPTGKRVKSVTVATLAADGAEDRFNPVFNTRLLAKLFRNSKLEIYKDAGHAFLFQPDTKYVTRVNAFLAKGA
jgi:pimeloyl-ACP methyl ester carboxylesterase